MAISRYLPGLLLLALVSKPTHAQVPDLVTDRPDQTESSLTVMPGLVQLEAGWTFVSAAADGVSVKSHSVPQTLIRIGIVHGLEARLGFAGWTRLALTDSTSESGFGGVDLGFKYHLLDGSGVRPDIGLLAAVALPIGSSRFRSARADPSVRLAFANALTERIGLGYNVGASVRSFQAGQEIRTVVNGIYTVVLGIGLTDRVGVFIESFGALELSDGEASVHALDGGITMALLHNLQIDVSGGVGLNAPADDWFIAAGISLRVPR